MSTWNVATYSLVPGTTNVHSIQMAYEWKFKQQLRAQQSSAKSK